VWQIAWVIKKMPYFLDSNVLLGYLFLKADTWGDASKAVIECHEKKYSGITSKHECFGTLGTGGSFETKKGKISKEFRVIRAKIIKGVPLSDILKDIQNGNWNSGKILKDIIETHDGSSKDLAETIQKALWDFDAGCKARKDKLKECVEFDERDTFYASLNEELEGFIPDPMDIPVILDAHHTSLRVSNLILVSGNYWDINAFRTNILRCCTSLIEVKNLRDFFPNST